MTSLCLHPGFVRLLSLGERISRRLRTSGKRQETGRIRRAFYDGVWQQAAAAVGAQARPLADDFWEIRLGDRTVRVRQNETPLDDYVTVQIAGDKQLTHRLVAETGVRVPEHALFTLGTLGDAAEFLSSFDVACVVKPATSTGGGTGVTTGVRSRSSLARAAATAAVYSRRLLIERQVPGDNYRLLYLDGRLIDAVRRAAPSVVGDGRSTVEKLLEVANAERCQLGPELCQAILLADLDMRHTLAEQGLTLASVPGDGSTVRLKTVINDNSALENFPAAYLLGDELIAEGARAAAAVGARFAGVDVVTADPGKPLAETGGAVIEVNTTPGFFWHYRRQNGAFPVAEHVLRHLFGIPQAAEAGRREQVFISSSDIHDRLGSEALGRQ